MGVSFTIAAGARHRSHSQVRVPPDSNDHILLPQIRDSPNLEGQVPIFISSQNRVAQLYLHALGSVSVALCDSQGDGGDNLNPPPHPEGPVCYALMHKFETDRKQSIS
jgi:hypothetical protein